MEDLFGTFSANQLTDDHCDVLVKVQSLRKSDNMNTELHCVPRNAHLFIFQITLKN